MDDETIEALRGLGIPNLVRIISQLPNDQDWVTKQVYITLKAQTDRDLNALQADIVEKQTLSAELADKVK